MIEWLDCVHSTNLYLKNLIKEGKISPCAVAARQQISGRGRMDRKFVSPVGGLYISFLLPWDDTFKITAKAAVAARRAIKKLSGLDCSIKWVNDLYYENKKVCGILAEGIGNRIVLGIGINWASNEKDLVDSAGSLKQNIGSIENLALELENQIYGPLENWLEEYKASCFLNGHEVDVFQAGKYVYSGMVRGVDDNCHLVLEQNGTQMVISTGEVSVRIK